MLPYKRPPSPPTVALLTNDRTVISEHGEQLDLDALPEGYRVWCDYDTVRELTNEQGYGEALCWNGEEIRWRHRRFEDEWRRRQSDVSVLRLPFGDDVERSVGALASWRDWLASYGASPPGTTGGAAWSLLRATITRPLWTSAGQTPPLLATVGGRQELGPAGQGSFRGELTLYDLPAAYASTLGGLSYGGKWVQTSELPGRLDRGPEWWASSGRPVFVRARVTLPGGRYGPLVRRPRKRLHGLAARLLGSEYPPSGRIQGLWTWQEVAATVAQGGRLEAVLTTWVHLSEDRPFAPWWEAVQVGRAMPGLAGLLAKTTGNALWGRFCMDTKHAGVRTIRGRNGRLRSRPLRASPGLPPAHDLAETVSGRVRARLYSLLAAAGSGLVSAHTDGAWVIEGRDEPLSIDALGDTWREKQRARRLDLLDPQVLRYWPRPSRPDEPWTVFAGVPARSADAAFDEAWELSGLAS